MTSVDLAPSWTMADAADCAATHFGLDAAASPLPSERDQNVALRTRDGQRFVLKIANPAESPAMLDAESAVMARLAPLGVCPTTVPTAAGEAMALADGHWVRLITWLPGRPLGTLAHRSPRLLADLGRVSGEVTAALDGFDHPALHREFRWDLARAGDEVAARVELVADPALRDTVQRLLDRYRRDIEPVLGRLARSVVHHDANDFNVLVDPVNDRVTGLLDFGDMVASHTVNDLAVACAYGLLDTPDPLDAAATIAAARDRVVPLLPDELDVLWGLAAMRLATSVCIAAEQQAAAPTNEYLGISQGPIAQVLARMAAIHPRLATAVLRAACGRPAVAHGPRLEAWLDANQATFASPTGHDLRGGPVAAIELSIAGPLTGVADADNRPGPMWDRIRSVMDAAGAPVGAGGYGEARLLYGGAAFGGGPITTPRRTVHLGVDLSVAEGSPVFAPLAGVVHAVESAPDPYDYGTVVVLRHTAPAGAAGDDPVDFHTLWGHVAADALDRLVPGQALAAGEQFATVGAPPDNGDWWPHIHLQLIADMLDVDCNVDGACLPHRWDAWRGLCPDPNLLLGIPPASLPEPAPTVADLRSRRARRIGGNLSVSYGADALHVVRGRMQYLIDGAGRHFIDAYNNVAHVGHGHPRVVAAVARQLSLLNTNTRYLQTQLLDYADALAARFPPGLDVVFLTASGSEANELALRLARAATGRRDTVVLAGAYHGHTTSLIDVSPYKHDGPGGTGRPGWVHTAPLPDTYRGAHRDPQTAGAAYAADLGRVLDAMQRPPAAFLAETCPSVGGQLMLPTGYLADVYARVHAAGGLCIADEVQTGFGRLGSAFWAFEEHGVVPDVVVLGKPIANGYPVGAVVTTRAIADAFDNGMEFFSTFGGSTAACAAAHETLRVTLDEGLMDHAALVGEQLLAGLREIQRGCPLMGDVRGRGLFLGVEMVDDPVSRRPSAALADSIVRTLRDHQVLAGTDGPDHNVVKLRGPMPLSARDVDLLLTAFARGARNLGDSGHV